METKPLLPEDQFWEVSARVAARHRQSYFVKDEPWTCGCDDCLRVRAVGTRRCGRLLRYGEQFLPAGKIVKRPTPVAQPANIKDEGC